MSKNVAVFVDVANIFYAAKAAGVDIDYVTLLKSASAGRDLVRAYAYTGLDPDNENQRNFHDFLRRHGYKVVSKDIRKYGDGKVKANLDIELVVDMMKTARNLDIAIVVSGDGDFAPAIRAVQEMGVRVRGHQLPRQHLVRPDRGRRPVHRHHPARACREGLALGPARGRRRRRPVDDRGPRQADRGDRRRPRRPHDARPRSRSGRRGRDGRLRIGGAWSRPASGRRSIDERLRGRRSHRTPRRAPVEGRRPVRIRARDCRSVHARRPGAPQAPKAPRLPTATPRRMTMAGAAVGAAAVAAVAEVADVTTQVQRLLQRRSLRRRRAGSSLSTRRTTSRSTLRGDLGRHRSGRSGIRSSGRRFRRPRTCPRSPMTRTSTSRRSRNT